MEESEENFRNNNLNQNLVLLIDAAIANCSPVKSNAVDKLPPNSSQLNGKHLDTYVAQKKNASVQKGKFASNCDNAINTEHDSLGKEQNSQVQSGILNDSSTSQRRKEPVSDCGKSVNETSSSAVKNNETVFENTSQNMEELTNNHNNSENNLGVSNLSQKESDCLEKIEMVGALLTSQNTEQCPTELDESVNNSHELGSPSKIEDCLKDLMEDLIKEIVSKDTAVETTEKLVCVLRNKTNKINYAAVQGSKIQIKIPRRRRSKHLECCEEDHNISNLEENMMPKIVADVTPSRLVNVTPNRKRGVSKRSYENEPIDPLWLEPFKLDWKRELVIRSTNIDCGSRLSDVYYFSPAGQKLRSYREIQSFLVENHITNVTIENFTFQKRQIYQLPHDVVRDAVARGKGLSKTPQPLPLPNHNQLPNGSQSAPTIKISMKKTGQKRELPVNENSTPVRFKIKKVAKDQVVPPLKISCVETSGRKKSKQSKVWQVKETPPPSLKPMQNPSLASKPATRNILSSPPITLRPSGKTSSGSNNATHPTRKATAMNEKVKLVISSSSKNSAQSSVNNIKVNHSRPQGEKNDDVEVDVDLPSCSMNCPSLRDVMPTLQCINCLIFYHPSCAKVKEGEPLDSFVCINCKIRNRRHPTLSSSQDSSPCPIEPELVINSEQESPSNRSKGPAETLKIENLKASLASAVTKQNKSLPPPPLKRAPVTKTSVSVIPNPDTSNSPRQPPPLQRKPPLTPSTPPKMNHPETRNISKPVIPGPPPLRRGTPTKDSVSNTPILNRSAAITSKLLQLSSASPGPILMPASSFSSGFAVPVQGGTVVIRSRAPNQMFGVPTNVQRVVTAPVAAVPSSIAAPIKKLTGKLTSSQLALSSQLAAMSHSSGQTVVGELNNNQQKGQPDKQESTRHSRALKRAQWLSEKANSSYSFFQKLQFKYRFLMDVFKHLNTVDLVNASTVCKLWKDAAFQEEMWKTIKLKGITVSDWEKLVKIMQKKGTRKLDLTEMKTFEDCNRTWHEFVAVLQQIKTTKLEEINFGYVTVSVFHAVLDVLTDIKVLTAESIVDVMNSSHGTSSCRLRLGNIEKLKNLRKLRLRGVHGINLPLTQNYSNLNELASLQHLNHLALTTLKDVPSSEFLFLKDLTNLTTLELGSCINWTAQVYKHLLNLRNLSRLRLECGSDKEGCLGSILRNSKIQILELIDFKIDQSLLKDIASMQNLEGLSLKPDDSIQPKIVNAVIMENVKYLRYLKVFKWQVKVQKNNTPDDDDIIVLAERILDDSQCSGDEPNRRMNNIPFLVSVINSSIEYTNIEHLTNSILKVLSLRCRNGKVILYGSDESRDVNSFNFISIDEIQKVQSLNVK